MIVSNVNSGPKAEYGLSGTVLTLSVPGAGSISVDLQEKQRAIQRTLDFSLDRSYERIAEGVGSWSVATVKLPSISTEMVDTGEVDEDGNPVMEERELDLDTSKVELHLWGLPEAISDKNQTTEEETE